MQVVFETRLELEFGLQGSGMQSSIVTSTAFQRKILQEANVNVLKKECIITSLLEKVLNLKIH